MRFDKFTIKSQELIQQAQSLASQYHHQQLEPEHLLASMLAESEGVTQSIFRKMGVSPESIRQEITLSMEKAAESERHRRGVSLRPCQTCA